MYRGIYRRYGTNYGEEQNITYKVINTLRKMRKGKSREYDATE